MKRAFHTTYASFSLLIKTPSFIAGEACPINLPDIDGCYMKVYRETLDTFRVFFHAKSGLNGPKDLEAYSWGGYVIECHTYSPFWKEPDAQRVGLQIWELGQRPVRSSCKKRKSDVMTSMNVDLFKKKFKL